MLDAGRFAGRRGLGGPRDRLDPAGLSCGVEHARPLRQLRRVREGARVAVRPGPVRIHALRAERCAGAGLKQRSGARRSRGGTSIRGSGARIQNGRLLVAEGRVDGRPGLKIRNPDAVELRSYSEVTFFM